MLESRIRYILTEPTHVYIPVSTSIILPHYPITIDCRKFLIIFIGNDLSFFGSCDVVHVYIPVSIPVSTSIILPHYSITVNCRKFLIIFIGSDLSFRFSGSVSYTHLRAHETDSYLVCRLLLEK